MGTDTTIKFRTFLSQPLARNPPRRYILLNSVLLLRPLYSLMSWPIEISYFKVMTISLEISVSSLLCQQYQRCEIGRPVHLHLRDAGTSSLLMKQEIYI